MSHYTVVAWSGGTRIPGLDCEHRHRSWDAAHRCAAGRHGAEFEVVRLGDDGDPEPLDEDEDG